MEYTKVYLDAFGFELAPVVVTSAELEEQLRPMYEALRIPMGQLEALTGISERRWWEEGYPVSKGATSAAIKALEASGCSQEDIETLIYAGVCREHFEPATACHVAAQIGVSGSAAVYDISNACLGVLNGITDIANRIELGQIRAGMVVSCETARDINHIMIRRMLQENSMEFFARSLATLTGGSGAVAIVITDGSFLGQKRRKLMGGVTRTAPIHHNLCRWGIEPLSPNACSQFMSTDSVSVMKYGVQLGIETWKMFLEKLGWSADQVDKIICHQVGSAHQQQILKLLDIPEEKDFTTYAYLGNMGTVSLPMTAALAEEYEFLQPGDRVGFLGIGSGLNCTMLGLIW
jgi:acyl-CoA:acyl-CoA alkyltransferase